MLDERFTPSAFMRPVKARKKLLLDLESEVGRLLAPALETAMADVVAQLNALGHKLEREENDDPLEICYETAVEARPIPLPLFWWTCE